MITPPLPASPRLVLFDLDDTLCDYAGARRRRLEIAFGLAAEASGLDLAPVMPQLIMESVAINPHSPDHFGPLLARYGISDQAAVEAAKRWYRVNRFHTLSLFRDTIDLLETLHAAESVAKIGLVTNGPSDIQRQKIALLGIESRFDFIIVSEEFGKSKPDLAIYDEALRLGNAPASDAIFVGDSAELDVAGAQADGIAGVWVNPGGRAWDIEAPPPALVVADLTELRRRVFGEMPREASGTVIRQTR